MELEVHEQHRRIHLCGDIEEKESMDRVASGMCELASVIVTQREEFLDTYNVWFSYNYQLVSAADIRQHFDNQ